MAEELKACPFCGGDAESRLFDAQYFVQCVKCFNSTAADHELESSAIAAWNSRAQLPSQGGEAVEVSAETFSSDGTSDIITRNLPIGTKLYTHPADQVEDGVVVSRELLKSWVTGLQCGIISQRHVVEELRAQLATLEAK
jgi:Lar family restriction alleviation protein